MWALEDDGDTGVALLWVTSLFSACIAEEAETPQEAGSPSPEAEASPCGRGGRTEQAFQLKTKALCLMTERQERMPPCFLHPQAPGVTAGPLRQCLMQPQHRKEAAVAYGPAEGKLCHTKLFCPPLGPLLLAEA